MLKSCYLGVTAACLAAGLCLPVWADHPTSAGAHGARLIAEAAPGGGAGMAPMRRRTTDMSAGSKYTMPATVTNWSHAYELTPMDMKRLRAYGLRDQEIFVVANTANLTGMDVDDVLQHALRGETPEMMASEWGIPVSELTNVNPLWQSPEWDRAVREGLYYVPMAGSMAGGEGRMAPTPMERQPRPARGRRNRGSNNTGGSGGSSNPRPDMTR